jgi:hypothetical protein
MAHQKGSIFRQGGGGPVYYAFGETASISSQVGEGGGDELGRSFITRLRRFLQSGLGGKAAQRRRQWWRTVGCCWPRGGANGWG